MMVMVRVSYHWWRGRVQLWRGKGCGAVLGWDRADTGAGQAADCDVAAERHPPALCHTPAHSPTRPQPYPPARAAPQRTWKPAMGGRSSRRPGNPLRWLADCRAGAGGRQALEVHGSVAGSLRAGRLCPHVHAHAHSLWRRTCTLM